MIIDGMVCIALLYIGISNRDHLIVSLIGTALYILLKDGLLKGISIGKFFAGIRVIRLRDGYSAEIPDSILRNFIFIIPGLSLAGIVIEIILLYKDKQGIRVGDKIAHTQVVIGKSCYEYIKDFVFYADDRSRSHDKIA